MSIDWPRFFFLSTKDGLPLIRKGLTFVSPPDKGRAYQPAIFYDDDTERRLAEESKSRLQAAYPDWEPGAVLVPILPSEKFWPAEDYHQDYYIVNEDWYGYYKKGCGRVERLKEVFGKETYKCYHTETPCDGMLQVMNDANISVASQVNIKGAPTSGGADDAAGLPTEILAAVVIASLMGAGCLLLLCCKFARNRSNKPPAA